MALNTLIILTIILSTFVVGSYTNEENKKGPLYKLCGDDFAYAHDDCCNNGCANVQFLAPNVVEALEKRGSPLMPSRVAKNFLSALRKRAVAGGSSTSAVEECCNEGCSTEEISEYGCFR